MNLKQPIFRSLFVLVILLSYQNCAETKFTKRSEPQPVTAVSFNATLSLSNRSANEGDNINLRAQIDGQTPADAVFLWSKDGISLSTSKEPVLVLNNLSLADQGSYQIGLLSDTDYQVSATANLTVLRAAPDITDQPKSLTVNTMTKVTFSVTATGKDLSYQWRFKGNDLSAATTSSHTISSAQTSDHGDYSVVVTNAAGSVTSGSASLTVNTQRVVKSFALGSTGCGSSYCSCHESVLYQGSTNRALAICKHKGYSKLSSLKTANGPIGQRQCHSADGASGCFTNANPGNLICTKVTCERE